MTRVVNLRHEKFDVRIDRRSKWGNPFRIGKDGTRAEVIEKYAIYIRTRPDLLAALDELDGKTLGCWCHPEACHGDVLVALLEARKAVTKTCVECNLPTAQGDMHHERCVWCANGIGRMATCDRCQGACTIVEPSSDDGAEADCPDCGGEGEICLNAKALERLDKVETANA